MISASSASDEAALTALRILTVKLPSFPFSTEELRATVNPESENLSEMASSWAFIMELSDVPTLSETSDMDFMAAFISFL